MRIVLKITAGPDKGRTIELGPGETRLVGRAKNADVKLEDPYLSDIHFGLYADEAGACRARDLYSSNGTLRNGAPLEEAILENGDRIAAGETVFEVKIAEDGDGGR